MQSLAKDDDYPFYFFALRIMNLPNVQETAKAEKELCSFISKNCELSKEKGLKFSIMKLYEGPDEKSKVVGAFVNALKDGCYGNDEYIDHCKESGKASFVVLIDGTKLSLGHYLSIDESQIDQLTFYARIGVGYGEDPHNHLRYIRAVDALPKEEVSFYKPAQHWYALASPKLNGDKLWFRYNSDLRSIHFSSLGFGHKKGNLVSNACTVLFNYMKPETIKKYQSTYLKDPYISQGDPCFAVAYYVCGILDDNLKIMPFSIKEYKKLLQPHYEKFSNISHPIVTKKYSSKGKAENLCQYFPDKSTFNVPVAIFYKNGFLHKSVWFGFIEVKKFFEEKKYIEEVISK